jgi:hypothetical protein
MSRLVRMAAILVLSGFAHVSQGQTLIQMRSQPGDWVGAGQNWNYTPAEGAITAVAIQGRSAGSAVGVGFSGATRWSFEFEAPPDRLLGPTNYEEAREPRLGPHPRLNVSGDGRGCNGAVGRFVVHDAAFSLAGELLRFAADFEQHCAFWSTPALFGSIRINSGIPVLRETPDASAGLDQLVAENVTVQLDGAGDTWTPTRLNFFCFWLGQIPLACLLAAAFGLGPVGVFIAVPISFTVLTLWSAALFRRGRWKEQKV